MKKNMLTLRSNIVVFFLILLLGTFAKAQTYEILKEAGGELTDFKTLYDGDNLFGYLELHKLDKVKEKTDKYKYILLDKNFNKISTNEFEVSRVNSYQKLSQALFNKGKILLGFSELQGIFYKNQIYRLIDIKTSTVSDAFTLQNSKMIPYDQKVLKDELTKSFNDGGFAYNVKGKGFLLADRSLKGTTSFVKTAIFIDLEGKNKWELPLKTGEKEGEFYEYDFLANDEKSVALRANLYKKKKYITSNLMIVDTETGTQKAFTEFWDSEFAFIYSMAKFVDNELVLVGEYFKKKAGTEYPESMYKLGVFRKSFDRDNGTVLKRNLVPFTELKKFVDINEYGKISKDGTLDFKDFEIRPDGTNLLFGETFKSDFMTGGYKFPELFYMILDADFKPVMMKSSEVNTTLYSKYMYGQNLQNNQGYASFFVDKDQEKKMVLNVLVYKDKEFRVDKIELEKKSENTWFFPAKNGYVGLIDYYKKDKVKNPEQKQAELHLEKINIE